MAKFQRNRAKVTLANLIQAELYRMIRSFSILLNTVPCVPIHTFVELRKQGVCVGTPGHPRAPKIIKKLIFGHLFGTCFFLYRTHKILRVMMG